MIFLILGCEKENPKRPDFLNISGTITDKSDSLPIQHAKIYVKRGILMSMEIIDTTLRSDSNGRFSYKIAPVDDFSYTILVEKSGYITESESIDRNIAKQDYIIQLEKD